MRSLPFCTVLFFSALILAWNYSIEDHDRAGADFVLAAADGESGSDSTRLGARPSGVAAQEDGGPIELVALEDRARRERLAGAAGDEPVILSGDEIRGHDPVLGPGGRPLPDSWVYDVETYPDGGRHAAGYRAGGLRVGHWIEWYEDGTVKAEGEYLDDAHEGDWVHHYRSGSVHRRESYRDGDLYGRRQVWHENGALIELSNFEGGSPSGEWSEWYSDGQLRSRGRFADGKHTGDWEFYDPDGRVNVRTGYYVEGRRTGSSGGQ